jgi:hypothetical protein
MLTAAQISLDDSPERAITKPVRAQAVKRRCKSRDPYADNPAATPNYTVGFTERCETVMAPGEMVERAHQEHGVVPSIGDVEPTRIAAKHAERSVRLCLCQSMRFSHVARDRIHEQDVVSSLGQPAGIRARTAADVQNRCRRRW